jgi:hypothetical protein
LPKLTSASMPERTAGGVVDHGDDPISAYVHPRRG